MFSFLLAGILDNIDVSELLFFWESIGKKSENKVSIKLIKLANQMYRYKMLSAE